MSNKILTFLVVFSLLSRQSFAANDNGDFMHNIGKIYVVVAVLIATFLGMAIFMIYLDRRISRLEKEQE
jgi:hypothetical protein